VDRESASRAQMASAVSADAPTCAVDHGGADITHLMRAVVERAVNYAVNSRLLTRACALKRETSRRPDFRHRDLVFWSARRG
jgi:hypothetical protein